MIFAPQQSDTRFADTTRLPSIKFLEEPTSDTWIEQAIAHLDTILLDHSHCERKAAANALNLMCRYPSDGPLLRELTRLAEEELEHFRQVNEILEERGIPLAPLNAPPYASQLKRQLRHNEPERKLDLLLVSGLIEARSHERLGLLATHLPEPDLAEFYRSLMASEARHYGIFWILATHEFPRDVVNRRLRELAQVESEILASLHPEPRIHS
ncbi:tRNA-(ms[2]io[6]A)-hydroxylase [Phormidium yuhuli AB48]|uniref:tRNA-(Ms[2]io[6]A)-hydroxylase n=1 Tax=Phormidium yuhuli AB48 TaxID=2940671 RepID=A0ABY5ASJ7_9CYAN|nr:tRNA-(ms[2]io[6]A)-hydroxylase [Phormidium yuhuli]USR91209.1 tRNA-(ms[2]io[6]A)-hydroxylase [Phormidium yuhuli AB48]